MESRRTKNEDEPNKEDGREEEANGASAKLLHQEEERDYGARQPDDERCKCIAPPLSLLEMQSSEGPRVGTNRQSFQSASLQEAISLCSTATHIQYFKNNT